MIGVVACESLYFEVERCGAPAVVRYIPQEFHEFPTSVPDMPAIQRAMQSAINDIDDPKCERIIILYADSPAVQGLTSAHATLVFVPIEDCVSAVLDRPVTADTGERKASGTYYLTRGTIDCGVDAYKLHAAYSGSLDALLERFDRAQDRHPDLRVTWPHGDRFEGVLARSSPNATQSMERVFFDILGSYERVELIDTGGLYDVHVSYAKSVREFVETLAARHGPGHDVEFDIRSGNTSRIERAMDSVAVSQLRNWGCTIKQPGV